MQIVSRRDFLASCSAVPLLALLPASATAFAPTPAAAQPPRARVVPVVDTYFGEQVVDPYRWMENANDPEWAPHLSGQTSYARSVLDSIPGRANLQRRILELSSAGPSVNSVRLAGSQLYYLKRPAGAAKAGLWTRPLAGGEERLLVDPDSWPGSANSVVREFSISPDGRLLLFGIDEGGREMPVYHLLETGTGTLLADRISRAFIGDIVSIHWRPDGAGFFYAQFVDGREPTAANMLEDAPLRFHRLGDKQAQDAWVVRRDGSASIKLLPTEWLMLSTSPDSPTAILSVGDGVGRRFRLYSAPLAAVTAGAPAWTPIAGYEDEVADFVLAGDNLYLLSVKDAPNGRLSRTSASRPRPGEARIIRAGNAVIEKIKAAADGLYIQTMDGGYGGIKRVGRDGKVSDVPLPYDGGIYELSTSPSADGAILRMSGWTEPLRSWRFDPDTGRTADLGLLPPSPHDLSGYQVVRTFATSGDGTRVPLSLVMKKGLPRDGSNPCLIEAYGAYGDSLPPAFLAYWLAFLEQGGIMGTAHVRGGGEYGHRWHMGGYKSSKPNSWRDVIACAEEAIRQGFTSPARLALMGGSAGGITVGRAMTERPDLFAAIVSHVGLNNTLRLEAGQNGSTNIQEFGSVATREGYAALRVMDSYHHVRDGQPYPAVLLTTGVNDPRVATWQVVKMAARLQAAGSPNPVLLRVDEAAGHGGGSTVAEQASQLADDFAFVLWRTGHRQFQRNGSGLGAAPIG